MVRKNSKTDDKKRNGFSVGDMTFLDKKGKAVKVSDFIIDKERDCWFLRSKGFWIMNHATIERLAVAAGISMSYGVEESPTVVPSYQNELAYIVRVTIKCNAKMSEATACQHSDENTLTVTGEANRINTPHRGRGYLRKMAEKRGFDIAVLKHLGLYTAIFSEEEAEEFRAGEDKAKEQNLMPGSKEFEAIVEEVNLILNAADKGALKVVGKTIKGKIAEKVYNEKQEKYLRGLFKKRVGELNSDL